MATIVAGAGTTSGAQSRCRIFSRQPQSRIPAEACLVAAGTSYHGRVCAAAASAGLPGCARCRCNAARLVAAGRARIAALALPVIVARTWDDADSPRPRACAEVWLAITCGRLAPATARSGLPGTGRPPLTRRWLPRATLLGVWRSGGRPSDARENTRSTRRTKPSRIAALPRVETGQADESQPVWPG